MEALLAVVHLLAAVVILGLLAVVAIIALDLTPRVVVPTGLAAVGVAGWFAVMIAEGYGVPWLPWCAAGVALLTLASSVLWWRLRRARDRKIVPVPAADQGAVVASAGE